MAHARLIQLNSRPLWRFNDAFDPAAAAAKEGL
jgi:hypothetical protein